MIHVCCNGKTDQGLVTPTRTSTKSLAVDREWVIRSVRLESPKGLAFLLMVPSSMSKVRYDNADFFFSVGRTCGCLPSFISGYDKQNCYPNVTVDGENKTRYVREPDSQHLVGMRYRVTSHFSL